jgi:hypothetical protein
MRKYLDRQLTKENGQQKIIWKKLYNKISFVPREIKTKVPGDTTSHLEWRRLD